MQTHTHISTSTLYVYGICIFANEQFTRACVCVCACMSISMFTTNNSFEFPQSLLGRTVKPHTNLHHYIHTHTLTCIHMYVDQYKPQMRLSNDGFRAFARLGGYMCLCAYVCKYVTVSISALVE